jgi:hypothetical protein
MARRNSSRVNYAKLVGGDSFLADFLAYMSTQETPHAYDFWGGIYALSCAVGRGLVVARPRAPVFLNLFCIFVAESGTTRKSTAVREAMRFVRPLTGEENYLIEAKTTPENLESILHKQSKEFGKSQASIAISELVTFLGREKYNEQMPTLLTDLYDCPELRSGGGTISTGPRTLKNVFVSFLSASTPAWLLRAVNPDVIEGGFTSRVCFIVAEEPKQLSAWPKEVDDDLRDRLHRRLRDIQSRSREVSSILITDGARKTFERWYKGRSIYRDPFRASFQSREDAHILRLAAFLCINDDTWCIQHQHILSAIKIITEVREDGASIFEGTGSNSRLVVGIDKVRDKLLAAGMNGLQQRDLTKAVQPYMDAKRLRIVLDIMHDLGMVQQFEVNLGRGRPSTIWRGLQPLMDSKSLDKIIENSNPVI